MANDIVHSTAEYRFAGLPSGDEELYLSAEFSSENSSRGVVYVSGVRLLSADARRVAIQLLELAEIAERLNL